MESPRDVFLQEDLERNARELLQFSALRNTSVLITGATGLVGSLLAKTLLCHNRLNCAGVQILLLVRSKEKAEAVFGELLKREEISLIIGDVTQRLSISRPVDYIVHCASVTASKMMVTHPVETIFTALDGTRNILEFARTCNAKSVVYVSSMEMYGAVENGDAPVTEEMSGYLDPLAIRSNYPASKRMCENMCVAYSQEYGLNIKIARLAQTFGAGILPGENRVFAQFARSAMEGTDIVLHTKGLSHGNYCYTSDVITGLMYILISGENGHAYNVVNEETHTTIGQMAQMVAEKLASKPIRVVFDIPQGNTFGYAQDTKLWLSAQKLRSLGWEPKVGLEEAYRRMMGSMKQQKSE
ncbi:MAG: NAD(P)-dependent oxidoreductase [Ruminococcaceae bacterium]|nr:NAD(P)-dependent oxidoreductase [Oscillospiraceae bacterium]